MHRLREGRSQRLREGLRVPRHRHRVFAGDHPRGTDYCRLWRPARTVKRPHHQIDFPRRLLVSVPLTQKGAVYLDEEEKTESIFGVLVSPRSRMTARTWAGIGPTTS